MRGNKGISIKQVALLANVSTATVSRVLNGNGRCSDATRDRVMRLIRETGYVPNSAAKALRTKTARAVGLVVANLREDFFGRVVDFLGRAFFDHGYSLFICGAGADAGRNRALINNLMAKGVDGLMYVSRFPLAMERPDFPVVCIDRLTDRGESGFDVVSDNRQGGRLAAAALLDAGSRRPVVVYDPDGAALPGSVIPERIRGFEEVLLARGVPWSYGRGSIHTPMRIADARREIARAVAANRAFDGVFATVDAGAFGVVLGLADAGVAVPGDVNVIGFDDAPLCGYSRPPLSTIRQDVPALANAGVDALVALMEGRRLSVNRAVVPVELVNRGTTRAVASVSCGES